MLNLNAKERILLQDEKSHEELCVEKYNKYSKTACDPQLQKFIFSTCTKGTTTSKYH